MSTNLLEEFRLHKEFVKRLIGKACDYKWLPSEEADSLLHKIESATLTLGIIGQMKCGKSTFLNSFVFEKDILPSATTPMTASLTLITYGEQAKVKVEFYSPEEWQEQINLSQRSTEGLADYDCARVQAARELVEKSKPEI